MGRAHDIHYNPANTGQSPNAVSKLDQRRRRWANIETVLGKCPVFAGNFIANTKHSPNVGTLLGQRRRRWASNVLALGGLGQLKYTTSQRTQDVKLMLFQCRANVADSGPTLKQHWFNVSC